MATKSSTQTRWQDRVAGWRASGLTASDYAAGKGFKASTLRFWASRLGSRGTPSAAAPAPRIVPLLVRSPPAPLSSERCVIAAPSAARAGPEALFVEVGAARVRIHRGFDPALLADVVRALAVTGGAA